MLLRAASRRHGRGAVGTTRAKGRRRPRVNRPVAAAEAATHGTAGGGNTCPALNRRADTVGRIDVHDCPGHIDQFRGDCVANGAQCAVMPITNKVINRIHSKVKTPSSSRQMRFNITRSSLRKTERIKGFSRGLRRSHDSVAHQVGLPARRFPWSHPLFAIFVPSCVFCPMFVGNLN